MPGAMSSMGSMGRMSTGPSTSFMSKLGSMAPGILGGMSGAFGDPEISGGGSGMPLNRMIGMQRPRNRGMQSPVPMPGLIQPPTNIPGMNMPPMGPSPNMAPGLTDMMGPSMPQSVSGAMPDMGMSKNGQNTRFSMPSNNSGFTGGMGGGQLWDIYSKLLGQGNMMGMM